MFAGFATMSRVSSDGSVFECVAMYDGESARERALVLQEIVPDPQWVVVIEFERIPARYPALWVVRAGIDTGVHKNHVAYSAVQYRVRAGRVEKSAILGQDVVSAIAKSPPESWFQFGFGVADLGCPQAAVSDEQSGRRTGGIGHGPTKICS